MNAYGHYHGDIRCGLDHSECENPVLMVRGRQMYPQIRRTMKNVHEPGVNIIAATDTVYRPNSKLISVVGIRREYRFDAFRGDSGSD